MRAPGAGQGTQGSLRSRAGRGLGWALGSLVAARAVNLLATLVLARLLAPDDFGVLAVPLLVIAYLETAGDLGTGAALIQRDRDREASSLVTFATGLALSLPWAVAAWLGAEPVAAFFGRPDAAPVIRLLAWTFPLKALGNTHDALLQRDLRFGRRAAAEMSRAAVKALVAIALAVLGFGAWSLAWGQLCGTLAWVAALWVLVPFRPWRSIGPGALARAREALSPMLTFGLQVVVINVLAALLHHLDKVIVGRVAGLAALGLYAVAAKLPEAAVTTLTWAVGRVAFPAFARAQSDPDERRRVYLDAFRLVALTAVPAGVGLLVVAEPVVLVTLGASWASAAAPLGGLAIAAALRALGSHAGDLMKGVGRADVLRNLAFVKVAVVLPALFLGSRTGEATAIAWALAAATLVTSILSVGVALRLLELPASALLRAAAPAITAAAVMGLVVAGLGVATSQLPAWADLALRVPAGVATWAATCWLLWADLRTLLRGRLAARRARGVAP